MKRPSRHSPQVQDAAHVSLMLLHEGYELNYSAHCSSVLYTRTERSVINSSITFW
ncbi:MAG: hypothetical protein HFG41_09335 [Coprococcus sp.]|nr:hypothetical protein [Coprococcus sp.]